MQPTTQSRAKRHHQQNMEDQNRDAAFSALKARNPHSAPKTSPPPSVSLAPAPGRFLLANPPPAGVSKQAHTQKKTPVLWFYRCMFFFCNSEVHAEKNRQIRDELNMHVNYDGHFRHMHATLKEFARYYVNFDGHFRHVCKVEILHSLEPLHTCHRRI